MELLSFMPFERNRSLVPCNRQMKALVECNRPLVPCNRQMKASE